MTGTTDRLSAALADRYRIERELGQGGMATVYLAEDLKHKRKVAVKVLKPELAAVLGAERFVQEITTTAALQHPHILPLFDSGTADGFLYYVMPFIDGETLRDKLNRETQFGVDEAVKIASDVADALHYAHSHGVIHRDIKPENILLANGRPMVADFGIALAVSAAAGGRMTETGLSLGTPHYMSPEQATAEKEITARSDVYSLASVLYEMLAGEPPHGGGSAQQIIMKIITETPQPVTARRKSVPPNVSAAVSKALEKLPADRFGSAAEFAGALANPHFGEAERAHAGSPMAMRRSTWAAIAVAGAALAVVAFLLGRQANQGTDLKDVVFAQRTYVNEAVLTARFTHDGETIVYSAATEGSVPRIYVIRSDYPEPRPLSEPGMHLLSVSSKDEMAVLVGAAYVSQRMYIGTLARLPLGGGAPRELLAGVREADWAPDGSALAIIHEVNGKDRLEFPIGTVLFESGGYLSDLRIAPSGDRIAFFEHPRRYDDRGFVATVNLKGARTILTGDFWGLEGLAWDADGKRIVFGGAAEGGFYQGYAVADGHEARVVLPNAGTITVQDVSPAGRWLVTRDEVRSRLLVVAPGARRERDLSWLNRPRLPQLSARGEMFAFENDGPDAGTNYATMMRRTDGSPAVVLGEGGLLALSPDTRWVVSAVPSTPARLMLHPTGTGQSRRLDKGELQAYTDAAFFPNGTDLLVCGIESGRAARCYIRPLAGGPLRALTPEGAGTGAHISPDGQAVVVAFADGYQLYPATGGAPRTVPGLKAGDEVVRWSPDGHALWITRYDQIALAVEQVDIASGQRRPLLTITPESRVGVLKLRELSLADDPHTYAYSTRDYVSRIFLIKGIR